MENMAGNTLGSTSRTITRRSVAPCARDASTNSRWAHCSVLARVMRARIGVETIPSATMSTSNRLPDPTGVGIPVLLLIESLASTDTSATASTNCGMASRMLKMLVRTVSMRPR